MLRRPGRSSFAAGAFVFPGGALDAADGSGEAAYAVAGVREVLEEVGILIGGGADGVSDGDLAARIGAARSKLLAGGDLVETLTEHDLVIAPERLVYIGHFITPPREGRRYDTRFFALAAPGGQEVRVHAAEAVEGGWHRPESDARPRVSSDHAAHPDDVPRVRPARIRRRDPEQRSVRTRSRRPRSPRRSSPAGWRSSPSRADRRDQPRRRACSHPTRRCSRVVGRTRTSPAAPPWCASTPARTTTAISPPSSTPRAPVPAGITTIVLTHSHPDHRPLALRLARADRSDRALLRPVGRGASTRRHSPTATSCAVATSS